MLNSVSEKYFKKLKNTMQQTFIVFQLNVFYNYQLNTYIKE